MNKISFRSIIGITCALLMVLGVGVFQVSAVQQAQPQGQSQDMGQQSQAKSANQQSQAKSASQQSQSQIASQRITQEQAVGPGAQLYIGPAALRVVQQKLSSAGYSAGSVDGIWGKNTQQALVAFQKANNLEPTGKLNLTTIERLGVPQVLSGGGQQQQSGQRLAQETTVKGGGAPLYISPANLRQIQQQLNQKGYSPGQIDGVWGQGTRKAIKNYEQAQGLEPTGNVDLRLVSSLGLNQLIAGLTGQGQQAGSQMAQQGAQNQQAQQGRGYYGGQQQGAQSGAASQKWTQEQASGSGAPLYISPATVRQIQQALNQAGYESGNVQGNWDARTSKALMNYQQANGLEPTGNLNISSIDKLVGGLNVDMISQGQQGQQGTPDPGAEPRILRHPAGPAGHGHPAESGPAGNGDPAQ